MGSAGQLLKPHSLPHNENDSSMSNRGGKLTRRGQVVQKFKQFIVVPIRTFWIVGNYLKFKNLSKTLKT